MGIAKVRDDLYVETGNVGIKDTKINRKMTPEEKLHIKDGSLRIDDGQIKSWGTIEFQPNTDQSAGEDLIKFLDKDANSVAIIKDFDGKVGIGTTDPKGELHLVGNLILGNDTNDEKFIMHPRTNGDGDALYITNDKSDGGWEWDQGIILRRGGNVGMGTRSPSEKLEVNGSIKCSGNINGASIKSGYSGWAEFSHKDATHLDHYALSQHSNGETWLNAAENQKLIFSIHSSKKMILSSNGRLGIGTTSPRATLDVNGSISSNNGYRLYKDNTSSSEYWKIYPEWWDANDPDLMFNYSAKTAHSGWVAGWLEPQGGGWRNPSDQSIKKDIEPISNVLEEVMKLQAKTYRWLNSDSDSVKSLGFIAQEVESVFPDCVIDKHDLKTLNYKDFAVIAIAAIQEQQQQIELLQEEVAQLKQ